MQIIQGKTRRQRVMERVLWDVLRDLLRERAEDGLLRASILDFKPKLANRCKLFPDSTLFRALILNFKPRIGNRCSDGGLQAELITLRQRSRSGNEDQNRTRNIVATAVCRRN